jgi:hypothetical protein
MRSKRRRSIRATGSGCQQGRQDNRSSVDRLLQHDIQGRIEQVYSNAQFHEFFQGVMKA